MIRLIYAVLSLLWAHFVVPVYSQELPTNATTGHHRFQHLTSRAPAIGAAHVLCSDAARFQRNPHDNWEPCINLFYQILKNDDKDFLSDSLWAPKGWYTTILADKQCPQQWHQGQEAHSLWRETIDRVIQADQRRRQTGATLSSTARAPRP